MAKMVMTILEAHVAPDQWQTLQERFSSGPTLPPQMVETFMAQSASDPTLWRAITVWRSREALDEYRRSVETPGGVLFFRAAGAEPVLSIFEIASHQAQGNAG